MTDPVELDLPVDGGTLRVLRFGTGPRTAVAAHGLSASAMSFGAVARQLPSDWSLFALDLRGRGGSDATPGRYGMDTHAADICAAAERWGAGAPVTLTGHSMGAYIALRAAARRPELFGRLLLIDGGLPFHPPADIDPDDMLQATLGPAIARLSMTYETDEAYVDFFRAHPGLGPYWSDDIEAYVRYDLTGPAGARRSRAQEAAVMHDGRELLTSAAAFEQDLADLALPAHLLYAPRGLMDTEPGMNPEPMVTLWTSRVPLLTAEPVPDCNHYTILMGTPAKVVADRLAA
ncbi:alpha/beta hydrolase [Streptomyces lunaelactis]|uniref:alpha/beta fold hydrolase n=1 Tax=Streptomyces lunaelactis TaxID=1535768 RepID=UPI00158458DA|nr:alpha/beta hydrolase [Streptomyces lunaelactis]NUK07445.1 alpha/beta hydrolase [Streptomyces lunaelactis]NUK24327.1 alpha/beta hydrolase [Streptomyces lunaelactis]NUK71357.1 alpha/beta hydrolase [Streptomyces lunaelactis]NUK78516.1 alpha/beta hydrolase [Streptomyces lunaelactis]NUL09855.1 alpha/beta hydrolase [Streptomyces lunaelactis]